MGLAWGYGALRGAIVWLGLSTEASWQRGDKGHHGKSKGANSTFLLPKIPTAGTAHLTHGLWASLCLIETEQAFKNKPPSKSYKKNPETYCIPCVNTLTMAMSFYLANSSFYLLQPM